MVIRSINKLKKSEPPPPPAPIAPPRQEVLLQEIRDLLARK
jgi:large conductance mechanosensitive channel